MNFSAGQLVKQSASQLLYYTIIGKSKEITAGQKAGEVYAENLTKSLGLSSEKRGLYQRDGHNLYFCIDAVDDNKYIEIKKVDDQKNYESWYLEMSIIQATFYATLLTKVTTLDTPAFRQKEGYEQEIIPVKLPHYYRLYFGTDEIAIYPNEILLEHYITKMNLIADSVATKDFDSCKAFDAKYKFKEYNIFKPNHAFLCKISTQCLKSII